jgi:hypothetical protein
MQLGRQRMKIGDCNVWQVAAGDTDRSYADLFLEWDVVANGPGYAGPWPGCERRLRDDGWSSRMIGIVRRLDEIADGDIVVLRLGTNEVHGVGRVVGNMAWYDDFGDVDGWDLQHVRRVRWSWRPDDGPMRFDTYTLKWGDTVQTMTSKVVLDWIRTLPEPTLADLAELPETCIDGEPDAVSDTEHVAAIGEFLFDRGLAADRIDALTDRMDDLVRTARWYGRSKAEPSEYETAAYLVTPLLRTLGWTPQRMAIEWNKVDVALFGQMPRSDSNLVAVVEAKRLKASCLSARSQAEGYAICHGRELCRTLVVTDGLRYAVFHRAGDGTFGTHPVAYLNLTRMRDHYPVLHCEGARRAILEMAPGVSAM